MLPITTAEMPNTVTVGQEVQSVTTTRHAGEYSAVRMRGWQRRNETAPNLFTEPRTMTPEERKNVAKSVFERIRGALKLLADD
ncbi:hypothetical protein IT575_02725 [bacterium]|nr:hypothetical protein [bacterium]